MKFHPHCGDLLRYVDVNVTDKGINEVSDIPLKQSCKKNYGLGEVSVTRYRYVFFV